MPVVYLRGALENAILQGNTPSRLDRIVFRIGVEKCALANISAGLYSRRTYRAQSGNVMAQEQDGIALRTGSVRHRTDHAFLPGYSDRMPTRRKT